MKRNGVKMKDIRCGTCESFTAATRKGRFGHEWCPNCHELDKWVTNNAGFLNRAREIGIISEDDWPYGPNISPQKRVQLVRWAEEGGFILSEKEIWEWDCLHEMMGGCCPVDGNRCGLGDGGNCSELWRNLRDHPSLWRSNGRTVLITQPYLREIYLNTREDLLGVLEEIREFSEVRVESRTWNVWYGDIQLQFWGSEGPAATLYRYYDSVGVLLYIGESLSAVSRLSQHKTKPWWQEITNIKMEHYSSKENVKKAEREAIETENPKYNVQFNRGVGNGV